MINNSRPWGWIVVDKGALIPSMAVTRAIKWLFAVSKVGHAGTLDPLATGILPMALGDATRLIPFLMKMPKVYGFTLTWGHFTTTDDCEGEIMGPPLPAPSREAIEKILPSFVGCLEQVPPDYCAAKIQGRRAYQYARQKQSLSLSSRSVRIDSLAMTHHAPTHTCFHVQCASGTYVRALARDMAKALGSAGHITQLRRQQVGPFTTGYTLDSLKKINHHERMIKVQLPQVVLSHIPSHTVTDMEKEMLWKGQFMNCPLSDGTYACYDKNDRLVALSLQENKRLRPTHCFKGL